MCALRMAADAGCVLIFLGFLGKLLTKQLPSHAESESESENVVEMPEEIQEVAASSYLLPFFKICKAAEAESILVLHLAASVKLHLSWQQS